MSPEGSVMLSEPASKWDESDLTELIVTGVVEDDRLDYKRELNTESASSKAELAKDVSSLANTTGGRLIYGMAESAEGTASAPSAIVPLTDESLPNRLIDILYERCQPNVRVRATRIGVEGGYCLVVDVPESLAPVMVTGKGQSRFYKRYDCKSVPMNERDIRERYERLLRSRDVVAQMIEEAAPVHAHPNPWWTGDHLGFLTLLLVPSFGPMDLFDPASFNPPDLRDLLPSARSDLWRYMGSGRATYFGTEFSFDNPDHLLAFLRLHRNGVAEFHYTLSDRSENASFYTITQANVLLDALEALAGMYLAAGYPSDVHIVGDYRHLNGYKIWIRSDSAPPIPVSQPLTYVADTSIDMLSEVRLDFVKKLLNRLAQAAGVPAIAFPLIDGVNVST